MSQVTAALTPVPAKLKTVLLCSSSKLLRRAQSLWPGQLEFYFVHSKMDFEWDCCRHSLEERFAGAREDSILTPNRRDGKVRRLTPLIEPSRETVYKGR